MSDVSKFLRHVGHWSNGIMIDRSGSLYAAIELDGFAAELAGDAAILDVLAQDNGLMCGIADSRLEWWDHYCQLDGQDMPGLPGIPNWFADRFDGAYRQAQGAGSFNKQRLFTTLVWHPGDGLRRLARALFGPGDSDHPEAGDRDVAQFEDLASRVRAGLAGRYGARRLGVKEGRSLPAEAWHVALLNRERKIGLPQGAIGPLIVPNRVTFGYRGSPYVPEGTFEVLGEGFRAYGAILSYIQPPARTWPEMLDELRALLIPMTITNSAKLTRRHQAVRALTSQHTLMSAARDVAVRGQQELADEAERIENREGVRVMHQFSVAVFAPDVGALDTRVAQCMSTLSDAGITAVRETGALKSAFYAQLPGNSRMWRTRPSPIRSGNLLALAAKHAVPKGERMSRWGAPIAYFRTNAGTAVPFHWHCAPTPQTPAGDLGNTLFIGRSGSGKTALLGSLALLTLRVPGARVLIVDRDFGLSTMVRAAGYPYLPLRANVSSGMVPLRRLSNTPGSIAFLRSLIMGLIASDDRGPIDDDAADWLAKGVEREMRKPPEQRCLANIGAVLGMRDRHGAAARLRRWCRGEEFGWAFDGETDELDLSGRMFGVDTTAILATRLLAGPAMAYLFHIANEMITSEPLLLIVDEMWAADQVDAFREQNNAWLATGRKREIVMGLATQSAHTALTSKIAHSFRQQVPRRIWFGEAKASKDELVDGMGLTESGYEAVTRKLPNMPFSFLVQEPGASYIARNDMSGMPGQMTVVSGRDSTYYLACELIEKFGADPKAWVPEFERLAPGLATRAKAQVA